MFVQPLLQWKSGFYVFWVCICNLRFPEFNAHAPYCHLCPVRLYNIFPHYLINGTIFEGENLLDTKFVFWLSLQLLFETVFIPRKLSEIWSKMYIGLHVKYRLLLSDSNKSWIFSTNGRNIVRYQISWKSVQVFRTDGETGLTWRSWRSLIAILR